MIVKEGKKGQVTIFIIIAILVVALGVLIYMFFPELKSRTEGDTKNPSSFISDCMQEKVEDTVEIVSLQGGSVNPGFYYEYYDNEDDKTYNLEYLCYTNLYYNPCVVQQPAIIQHVELEIKKEIQEDVESCFDSLKKSYETKGYDVKMDEGKTSVKLTAGKITTNFDYNITLTKGNTEKYQNFEVVLDNNLYGLLSIANSIINKETQGGEVETTDYMNIYHTLKIKKQPQLDGTKIYILGYTTSDEKFQFSIRSFVFPAGY